MPEINLGNVNDQRNEINLGNVNDQQEEIKLNNFRVLKLEDIFDRIDEELAQKVDKSSVGAVSGVASLDSAGKVPSEQLPSYVDDVIEYDTMSLFPATGEAGKIYVAKDTGYTYRWSGTTYIQISNPKSIIDDTAGDGDTDKVWSADKLHNTIPNISIQGKRLVIT